MLLIVLLLYTDSVSLKKYFLILNNIVRHVRHSSRIRVVFACILVLLVCYHNWEGFGFYCADLVYLRNCLIHLGRHFPCAFHIRWSSNILLLKTYKVLLLFVYIVFFKNKLRRIAIALGRTPLKILFQANAAGSFRSICIMSQVVIEVFLDLLAIKSG